MHLKYKVGPRSSYTWGYGAPLSRVITLVTHWKGRPFIRVITPLMTSRNPPCISHQVCYHFYASCRQHFFFLWIGKKLWRTLRELPVHAFLIAYYTRDFSPAVALLYIKTVSTCMNKTWILQVEEKPLQKITEVLRWLPPTEVPDSIFCHFPLSLLKKECLTHPDSGHLGSFWTVSSHKFSPFWEGSLYHVTWSHEFTQ